MSTRRRSRKREWLITCREDVCANTHVQTHTHTYQNTQRMHACTHSTDCAGHNMVTETLHSKLVLKWTSFPAFNSRWLNVYTWSVHDSKKLSWKRGQENQKHHKLHCLFVSFFLVQTIFWPPCWGLLQVKQLLYLQKAPDRIVWTTKKGVPDGFFNSVSRYEECILKIRRVIDAALLKFVCNCIIQNNIIM